MRLCDSSSSSYSAAQCYALAGGCQGALDSGSCYSYILWSCSSTGLYYTTYKLAGGSLVYTQGTCSSEGRCLAGYAFAVRCLLLARYPATCGAGGHRVRPHPYRPELRYAVSLDLIPADICSCATTMRVLLTVLHSVRNWLAAARARTILTATRTLFGRLSR